MVKLGPHIQNVARVNSAGRAWIQSAPIVKQMDGTAALRQARPDAIRVYRKFYQHQDVAAQLGGAALAREIIASLGGYRHPLLYVEFPFNEWRGALSELPAHIDLLAEGVPVFRAAGIRVCGYNFATGNPPEYVEAWDYIRARNYGGLTKEDAIGQHCYWGECGLLKSQWNGRRFEVDHNLLGDGHPPLLLTEVGRDGVSQDGSAGKPGWHLQDITPEQYVAELLAYDDLLARTPYVLGATLFSLGANDDWRQFEVDSIAHLFSVGGGIPNPKEDIKVTNETTQIATVEMVARQNALITRALIAMREGRWTGADGVDGMIVALNGGRLPDNYKPVFPSPKA